MKINIRALIADIQRRNPYIPKAAIARTLNISRARLHQMEQLQNGGILTTKRRNAIKKAFYSGLEPEFAALLEKLEI